MAPLRKSHGDTARLGCAAMTGVIIARTNGQVNAYIKRLKSWKAQIYWKAEILIRLKC